MKIDRSCRTCKFCFPKTDGNGYICASVNYGETLNLSDIKQQSCWEIGLNYWSQLIELLSDEQRNIFYCPFPSVQKKEFKRLGVDNETDYLYYCIEHIDG